MKNNPNQPREFDAVLGGKAPPPIDGVVLGGIEGVKYRLQSLDVEVQIAALTEAMNYGEAGLDLVIDTLQRSSDEVQRFAARLLREKGDLKGKLFLLDYDPWLSFSVLEDWRIENYNPQIGICDPIGTAYVVDVKQLKLLLQDKQASKVEALICQMCDSNCYYAESKEFNYFVNALFDARKHLKNLKALFIGDAEQPEYMKSKFALSNISPILEGYPNLEVLQVRGAWGLEVRPMRHECLKTLIVETGLMMIEPKTISQICHLELPALEYLELWLGGCHRYGTDVGTEHLLPILTGKLFPNLKYLGLRSSDYSDNIASYLSELSTVIDRLAILNLSTGTLTDVGAIALLSNAALNQLKVLDVSKNFICSDIIERLSQLNCQVIIDSQEDEEPKYGGSRYYALYE